jgi:hypothetical protein
MTALPVNIEIERLENLIRAFGWVKIEQKTTPEEIKVTISKKIPTE